MRRALSCLTLFFLAAGAVGANGPEPVTIGESLVLHSDVLDEDRTVLVSLPTSYESSQAPYPVVYLLDGRDNFHHTTGTLEALSRVGHVPEMIVVAVTNTDRTRDLTPSTFTPDPEDDGDGDGDGENPMPTAGGADKFLDFFEQELFPFVEKRYRAAPYRVLIGHSFGGLFAVHTLVHRPASFDAYVAISPSLWWEDNELVGQAEELFKNGADSGRKTLFLSLAGEGGNMLEAFQAFDELLRYAAPATLHWKGMMMEGDDHGSVPIRSTYHGLKTVFPRWRLPRFAESLDDYKAHYASLSERYGYEIPVPENAINRLGYRLLGEEEMDEAVAVFRMNVERYPESANVYDSLGDGLEAAGRLEEALASYARACAQGGKIDDPNLSVYQLHHDRLQEKLEGGGG